MRARWTALGAALSLLAPGCREQGGLSFDQFVNTTVELRQAASAGNSAQAFDARKRAIEAKHHVTDADLERFVRDHARDVKLLAATWDSVEARYGRAGARDSAARPQRAPYPGARPMPGSATPVTPGTATPSAGGGTPPRPRAPRF